MLIRRATFSALVLLTLITPLLAGGRNPIRLEGQISSVERRGDDVIIRLHRQKHPLQASAFLVVRGRNRRRMEARDLRPEDHIRVNGDLDQDVIYADRIELLRRDERR